MSITEDTGNQPAPIHSTVSGPWITGAFTPAGSTLVLVCIAIDGPGSSSTTCAVTDSGSHSWSVLGRSNVFAASTVGGTAELQCCWFGTSPGSISLTVTPTPGTGVGGNITPLCLLGASSAQTGTVVTAGSQSGYPELTLAPTQLGSRVYGSVLNWTSALSLTPWASTSMVDEFLFTANGDTFDVWKAAADTDGPGGRLYGFNHTPLNINMVGVEILSAAGTPVGLSSATPRPIAPLSGT